MSHLQVALVLTLYRSQLDDPIAGHGYGSLNQEDDEDGDGDDEEMKDGLSYDMEEDQNAVGHSPP